MQFSVTVTKEDYITFYLYVQEHLEAYKKQLRIGRISLPVLLAAVVFVLFLSNAERHFTIFMAIYSAIISIAWFLLFARYRKKSMIRFISRLCDTTDGLFTESCQMRFTEDTVVEETEDVKLEVNYKLLNKMVINSADIYLFYKSTTAFIIPAHCFDNDARKQEFIEFIKAKTGLLVIR